MTTPVESGKVCLHSASFQTLAGKNMKEKYIVRFERIKLLFWIALGCIPFLIAAQFFGAETTIRQVLLVIAILLFIPFGIYSYCMIILHWKDRYKGTRSDLWGILLLIETSGWFKLIYFFRHMIPDMRGSGRYTKNCQPEDGESTL